MQKGRRERSLPPALVSQLVRWFGLLAAEHLLPADDSQHRHDVVLGANTGNIQACPPSVLARHWLLVPSSFNTSLLPMMGCSKPSLLAWPSM